MHFTHVLTAAALLAIAGSARANASPIAANYVDDFGPVASESAAPAAVASPARASPIASNYVDDFGVGGPNAPSKGAVIAARR